MNRRFIHERDWKKIPARWDFDSIREKSMKRTLKKLFKKDKLNVMLVFVFIIGLSVMLYPPISSYWNSKVQSRAVASYSNAVKSLTEEEKDTMLKKADTYNEKLKDVNRPFLNYAEAGDYNSILDISGTGIMGYVTIEKLGVELPIYHGTSEGVLQVAAGHLEGSSLPVGGEGTHSVLSAHRGLPSARLFTSRRYLYRYRIGSQTDLSGGSD